MQHIWHTLLNIYCYSELSFLYCIVVLCGYYDSQNQGGCFRKWIGGTLQICKILKPGERFSSWREFSYEWDNMYVDDLRILASIDLYLNQTSILGESHG